jgi:hypothetical protein
MSAQMSDRLAGFMRSAARELRQLRGEVITALAVAAVIAVVLDERAAVVIGVAAIVVATGALLVLSSRLRPSAGPAPSQTRAAAATAGGEEESKISIAGARLSELASRLGLESPSAAPSEPPSGVRPRVSVIVPCFNDARFVAEALQSVIDQTYENWECMVVDDASTDSSWDVIE